MSDREEGVNGDPHVTDHTMGNLGRSLSTTPTSAFLPAFLPPRTSLYTAASRIFTNINQIKHLPRAKPPITPLMPSALQAHWFSF